MSVRLEASFVHAMQANIRSYILIANNSSLRVGKPEFRDESYRKPNRGNHSGNLPSSSGDHSGFPKVETLDGLH